MTQIPQYRHDLGNGLYLNAFSLDPNIGQEKLEEIVQSADGKAKANQAEVPSITRTEHLNSLAELTLEPQEGEYQVPKPLRAYREAIQKDGDSKGRFNGPVLITTGEIKVPLKVVQGGYYDFAATKLAEEPAKLLPEFYQQGKTVEDILVENGFSTEARAKYFGLGHLMWPSNGEEFLMVERAKGMGIASSTDDVRVIATPGSTPDLVLNKPGLKKSGFGVKEYWSYHLAEEMKDEFHLKWGDFWVGSLDLFEDRRMIPFGTVNIHTEMPISGIAKNAYGDPRVLKEHTIIYGMPKEAISVFLERFPVFEGVATAINLSLE